MVDEEEQEDLVLVEMVEELVLLVLMDLEEILETVLLLFHREHYQLLVSLLVDCLL